MIDINFYLEFLRLGEENSLQREKHLNDLVLSVLEKYNTNLVSSIELNKNKDEFGSFDPYDDKITIFNEEFLTKELTNEDMYEIIESVLHEPFHVKQYENYLKDGSLYPGFEVALPIGYGYFLQKEEDEAYRHTFKTMQDIIYSKYSTSGKEKLFYEGMQTYLDKRRSIFKESKENEIKALEIRFNEKFDDEERIFKVLSEIKTFAKINLDLKNIEKDTENLDLKVSAKEVFRVEDETISNVVDLYFRNDKTYGKIRSDNEFDKDNITFLIDGNSFNISNIFSENINFKRMQELSFSFFQIKDFYKNNFNTNLYPTATFYSIFDNNEDYKNLVKACFYTNELNLDGNSILEEYKLQNFKKQSVLYLKNESTLENVLETIDIDKNVVKLIYQNEDKFKNYLGKIKEVDSYKKLLDGFNKDEIKYNLEINTKLEKIIKENTIIQKAKNIFKNKNKEKTDKEDR